MSTLASLFASALESRPDAIALRRKRYGIWEEMRWSALGARVAALERAARAAGVGEGDRVAILAENGPDWVAAELAIIEAGAVVVACYPDAADADLQALLDQTRPRLVFVGDDACEQRAARLRGSTLRLSFDQVPTVADARPAVARAKPQPHDIALITSSVGTSGSAAPVSLSHANLLAAATALSARLGMSADDEVGSVLPLAHPAEQALTVILPMLAGSRSNFPETMRTLATDLAEIEPTVLLGMPRLWERFHLDYRMAIDSTSGWRRRMLQPLVAPQHDSPSSRSRWYRLLVAAPLRRRLGLRRVRVAISTGARLPESTAHSFAALGIQLWDGYGGARLGGLVALGAAGEGLRLLDGLEGRADPDRHLQLRGSQIPGAENGDWHDSGDLGSVEGDVFKVQARTLAGPQAARCAAAEVALEASVHVRHAVVTAPEAGGLAAVVCLEPVALAQWANKQKIKFTDYGSLLANDAVARLVEGVVAQANAGLAAKDRIGRYAIYENRLSVERGELTPILTLRYRRLYEWIDTHRGFRPVSA